MSIWHPFRSVSHRLDQIIDLLHRSLSWDDVLYRRLRDIENRLPPREAKSATLRLRIIDRHPWQFEDRRAWFHVGKPPVLPFTQGGFTTMPKTVNPGGTAIAAPPAFKEWDGPNGTGNEVPPVGPLVYSSSDSNVATVDTAGNVTAVAPGSSTITATDQGNNLSATDVLTVVPKPAQSATLSLQ